jgi:hypothetical protein
MGYNIHKVRNFVELVNNLFGIDKMIVHDCTQIDYLKFIVRIAPCSNGLISEKKIHELIRDKAKYFFIGTVIFNHNCEKFYIM